MKKIITIIVIVITTFASTTRADSYALQGLTIGSLVGITSGVILVAADPVSCELGDFGCGYADKYDYFISAGMFGLLGGALGAGIGALIPKESKITFSPTIAPTKDGGINAGGNLKIKF